MINEDKRAGLLMQWIATSEKLPDDHQYKTSHGRFVHCTVSPQRQTQRCQVSALTSDPYFNALSPRASLPALTIANARLSWRISRANWDMVTPRTPAAPPTS